MTDVEDGNEVCSFGTCEILILDCDMGGVKGKCVSFWRLELDGSEVDRLSERMVVCIVC